MSSWVRISLFLKFDIIMRKKKSPLLRLTSWGTISIKMLSLKQWLMITNAQLFLRNKRFYYGWPCSSPVPHSNFLLWLESYRLAAIPFPVMCSQFHGKLILPNSIWVLIDVIQLCVNHKIYIIRKIFFIVLGLSILLRNGPIKKL